MRLLITSLHYAPETTGNAPYTTGLAEHLASRGHSVVAMTGFPSYPKGRVQAGYRRLLWKREWLNGVDVRRRWHYVPSTQSAMGRGVAEATSLLSGLSLMALPRPDAVLGVVPSLSGGLLARLAARRFRVPYGLILQDLMGPAAEQSGVRGGGQVASAVRAAERWAVRGAGAVGIIAEGFRPYVEWLGVEPDRIQRVRNWTHIPQPMANSAPRGTKMWRALVRERLGLPQDAVLCLHAGNMGHKQGLENVVACARLAAEAGERLLFVLLGDGNQRPHLEELAARYRLPNLRFLPIQPADVFPNVLAAADVLLVNQRGSVSDMSLPSKLTSYFAAGRPIVAAVGETSEAAREVEASGGGLVVAPDEPRAMLEALLELAQDEERGARMGESARAWADATLSEAGAMESYEQFLAAVLGHPIAESPEQDVDSVTASAEESEARREESDGEQQPLVRQIDPGHRRRRLSRPARGASASDEGRPPYLRAA
jgi:glycosyltransferase involved in cell wall biosynthesis